MTAQLPEYIQRGGEICFNGPSRYQGVTLYGFMLEVSQVDLQSMADRYLNEPSRNEFRFRPCANLLLVTFVRILRSVSLHGLDRAIGEVAYNELGLWTFLESSRGMRAFSPYMWVDSPITMVSGRELVGFPKNLGRIRIPGDEPPGSPPFSACASSVATYGRSSRFEDLPVLEIDWGEQLDLPVEEGWSNRGDRALRDIATQYERRSWRSAPPDLSGLVSAILGARISWVFLKQIRSVEVPGRACYQALTEANTRVISFEGGHWLSAEKCEIRLHDLDSAPFVRELNLRGTDDARSRDVPVMRKPAVAFCLRFSFECDLGREIWRAPVPEWTGS